VSVKPWLSAAAFALAVSAAFASSAAAQTVAHRFAPLTPEMMTPEQKAVGSIKKALEAGTYNPNGFDAVLARNPGLEDDIAAQAARVYPVASQFYFGHSDDKTTIPTGLMEIGILMLAHDWGFPEMFPSHGPLALKEGLSQAFLDALQQGRRPAHMKADQAAIYDFSAAVIRKHEVSDALFKRVRLYLSERGVVDYTTTLGVYMSSISLLKVANIARH
jgi:hypothetical protein